MFISDIIEAEREASRFLERVQAARESEHYRSADKANSDHVWGNAETAALRRASMDLSKSLAKLRNNR